MQRNLYSICDRIDIVPPYPIWNACPIPSRLSVQLRLRVVRFLMPKLLAWYAVIKTVMHLSSVSLWRVEFLLSFSSLYWWKRPLVEMVFAGLYLRQAHKKLCLWTLRRLITPSVFLSAVLSPVQVGVVQNVYALATSIIDNETAE